MTTESFTKDNAVLLLIDHQTGVLQSVVQAPPLEDVERNVVKLARAARTLDLPVVADASVIAELAQDFSTGEGSELLRIMTDRPEPVGTS